MPEITIHNGVRCFSQATCSVRSPPRSVAHETIDYVIIDIPGKNRQVFSIGPKTGEEGIILPFIFVGPRRLHRTARIQVTADEPFSRAAARGSQRCFFY